MRTARTGEGGGEGEKKEMETNPPRQYTHIYVSTLNGLERKEGEKVDCYVLLTQLLCRDHFHLLPIIPICIYFKKTHTREIDNLVMVLFL